MDPSDPHLFAVKILGLLLLTCIAGCGMKMSRQNQSAAGSLDDIDGKNQLDVLTAGGYALELSTSDVRCHRSMDDQQLDVRFLEKTGRDAGLEVRLTVAGNLQGGDVFTPAGGSLDRFFDVALTTPTGTNYRLSSNDHQTQGGDGTLTILTTNAYSTDGRVILKDLPPLGAPPNGANTPVPLNARASFACHQWD